jgi:hypothetical protein
MFSKIFIQLKQLLNIGNLNIIKSEQKAVSEETKDVEETKNVEKFSTNLHVSLYDGSGILSGGNTKNLSNVQRNDNKSIFN